MQLDLIFSYMWLVVVKGFLYVALPYYLYTRIINVYLCYHHYKNQGYKVDFVGFPLPIIGNLIALYKVLRELIKTNDHKVPYVRLIE